MTLDRFLQFLISHNATIIEVLFGLTLLVVTFLAIRSFLMAKEPSSGSGAALDMGNLETMLQQILEKAGSIPTGATAGGGSEDSQRLLVEITNLKTDLEGKKKQIEEMKTASANAPAPAAAGLSGEEKAALDNKIQELQAKLSEYEIISEDIADLSFYKEQNIKLQKELEGLKGGGAAPSAPGPAAAAPAPTPAPAPPPPVETPKEEPAIVGKSKAEPEPVVAAAPAPEAPAPAAEAAAPAMDLAIDDDLMAEFAAAVEKQKTGADAPAPAPAAAAPAPAASAPAGATAAAPADIPAEGGDIDLGQMDMDKMLAEAAGIKADEGPEVSAEAALGAGLDESKLLQEAAALNSVSPEDKKLMGDFENFVKKGE